MDCKIRVKLGALEVEYEGNEAFLKGELLNLVSALADHHEKHPIPVAGVTPIAPHPHVPQKGGLVGTTGALATKLGAKTGPELALAAAAHLTLVKGKGTFTRKELTTEMRSANNFFKETYVKNLGSTLKTLQNANKFLEQSKDTFALTSDELARLKVALA